MADFFDPNHFTTESDKAKRNRINPPSILPSLKKDFGMPGLLFNALLGASAGAKAGQEANGDPLTALLLGAGGALQAPGIEDIHAQRQAAMAKAQLEQWQTLPIEQVAPETVKEYPMLKGWPVGLVHTIAPIIEKAQARAQAEKLAVMQEGGRAGRAHRAVLVTEKNALERSMEGVNALITEAKNPELYASNQRRLKQINDELSGATNKHDQSGILERMARPKGSNESLKPYISKDGGVTWTPK